MYYPHIGDRLLFLGAVAALLFSNLIILLTTSMAGYLRAHKEEPLLISSIIHAVVTVVAAWITAKYYDVTTMAYVIVLTNTLISLPLVTYVFLKKRKKLHFLASSKFVTHEGHD
jgi:hypothetical protein